MSAFEGTADPTSPTMLDLRIHALAGIALAPMEMH